MTNKLPSTLTIEEAVALLINLDYIPDDFTLEEILTAFLEEADVHYENAKSDRLPEIEIKALHSRMIACDARLTLARTITEDIRYCIEGNIETEYGDQLLGSKDTVGRLMVDTESLYFWAASRFGIEIWGRTNNVKSDGHSPDVSWSDVTIYLRSDSRVGYKIGKGKELIKQAHEIGFGHRNRKQFNILGVILLVLARGERYPPSFNSKIESKHKKHICVLRSHLRHLTGIGGDPFEEYDPEYRWRPKFKIKDKTNITNERAEVEAKHVPYDDNRYVDDSEEDFY